MPFSKLTDDTGGAAVPHGCRVQNASEVRGGAQEKRRSTALLCHRPGVTTPPNGAGNGRTETVDVLLKRLEIGVLRR